MASCSICWAIAASSRPRACLAARRERRAATSSTPTQRASAGCPTNFRTTQCLAVMSFPCRQRAARAMPPRKARPSLDRTGPPRGKDHEVERVRLGARRSASCCQARVWFSRQEFARITRGLDGVIGVPARLLITDTDAAGLASMNDHIALAARQLATCDPDLVVYMCTSGSFMDGSRGESELRRRLTDLTGKPVITTSQAVLEAHRALDIRRPVMLTPYDENLTNREIAWLKSNGVDVVDSRFGDIADNLARGTQAAGADDSARTAPRPAQCRRCVFELRQHPDTRDRRAAGTRDGPTGDQ